MGGLFLNVFVVVKALVEGVEVVLCTSVTAAWKGHSIFVLDRFPESILVGVNGLFSLQGLVELVVEPSFVDFGWAVLRVRGWH